jgi:RNA polymerase sigma-70 factor, ECF subfamily
MHTESGEITVMDNDEWLVEQALEKGAEGFARIVEKYRKVVFGIAVARLGHFHDAEDITQVVFLEAFQKLPNLREPERLGGWLRSITIHKCLNRNRDQSRQVALDDIEEPISSAPTPLADLERRELRGQVLEQISRLTPKQRETVTLFYLGEHQLSEVATIQGVPVGTIKRRLHDARLKLKQEMMDVVKETLKSEGPSEETTAAVLKLLNLHERQEAEWIPIAKEIGRLGEDAVPGLEKAMKLPHAMSRRFASKFLMDNTSDGEQVIELLKRFREDPNKRIRKGSLKLLFVDVSPERRRKEFIPLLLPLLEDPSARVRARAAANFCRVPEEVPLELASKALAVEQSARARKGLSKLVLSILDGKKRGYE